MRDVVISVGSVDGGWQQRELVRLDGVNGPTTVPVRWDGTFDGESAPPGRYGVSVSAAAPVEPGGGSCTAGNGSLDVGVTFVVP